MKRLAPLVLALLAFGLMAAIAAENKDGDMTEKQRVAAVSANTQRAIFAGGCFWCMEPPFEKLPGVLTVTSGYTGGQVPEPTYKQVSAGGTGHAEAIEIVFDPTRVSYQQLLEILWMNIDPTDDGGQFVDRGRQYRSAIFYLDEGQRQLAEASKQALEKSGRFDKPIVTEIVPATDFYPAEEYHQDYYEKHPLRYKFYRTTCGRDRVLDRLWGE
jgi:peptide-methionine (S)-S-oxide reductase